LFFRGLQPCPE